MRSCSIVIRCFNEEEHIGRLLTGISRQTLQPREIILVDSGSTDATLEIAARFPVQILSIAPEQFSFGRSLNLGCQAAEGEIIVIASAHVYPVYDTWLEELLAPFAEPGVALAYGKQQGGPETKFSEHQLLRKWFPAQSNDRQEHPFCNNANAAIRRDVWERIPYNEELTGLEDLDWAKRAKESGHHIAYVAEAPVVHVHRESLRQIVDRYRREAIAQKRIYGDTRFGPVDTLALAGLNIASDYYYAAREGVLLHNLAAIPLFRVAQFWGTYRGFAQRGAVSSLLRRRFYYPKGWRGDQRPARPMGRGRAIDYAASPSTEADIESERDPDWDEEEQAA